MNMYLGLKIGWTVGDGGSGRRKVAELALALAVGYGGGSGVRLDNGICYRKGGGGNSELALGSGAVEAVGSRGPGAVVVAVLVTAVVALAVVAAAIVSTSSPPPLSAAAAGVSRHTGAAAAAAVETRALSRVVVGACWAAGASPYLLGLLAMIKCCI